MAQLEVNFPKELFEELGNAADVYAWSPRLIIAALPILRDKLKKVYAAAGGMRLAYGPKMRDAALKILRPIQTKNGGFIGTVTFGKQKTGHYYLKNGKKYPLSYSGLAVFLEFGTKAHGNFPDMPAHGYISKAVAESEEEVKEKMQEEFEKIMQKLRVD